MTGPGGMLKALTKTVVETALDEEMTEHRGYDKHEVAGRGSGLPDSVGAVFPETIVQTCVIHLIRNTFKYASKKYGGQIAADLKPIYRAPSRDAGRRSPATRRCRPVDGAGDGDTVQIPAGRFAGGVVVTESIRIVGARVCDSGGRRGARPHRRHLNGRDLNPTVHISRLTLRSGHAHSGPESIGFTGKPGVFAGGGGLEIPAGEDFNGPQVTVTDSLNTENTASPIDSILPTPEQQPF